MRIILIIEHSHTTSAMGSREAKKHTPKHCRGHPSVRSPLRGEPAPHLCGIREDTPRRNTTVPPELGKCD